jgi:hypothetical protein
LPGSNWQTPKTRPYAGLHFRFGSKADVCGAQTHVCFTPNSDRESEIPQKAMSALARKRTLRVSGNPRHSTGEIARRYLE